MQRDTRKIQKGKGNGQTQVEGGRERENKALVRRKGRHGREENKGDRREKVIQTNRKDETKETRQVRYYKEKKKGIGWGVRVQRNKE